MVTPARKDAENKDIKFKFLVSKFEKARGLEKNRSGKKPYSEFSTLPFSLPQGYNLLSLEGRYWDRTE